jgi:hypothetical protein
LFCADNVVAKLLEDHSDVLCKYIARKMPDNSFKKFVCLGVKCKEEEIFLRNFSMAL